MFALKSSYEMPWERTAFSRSSIESSLFCLRISSRRRITSASGGDAEFLTSREQELLVDQVAKQGLLTVCELGRADVRLLRILRQLLLGALEGRCG